MAELRSGALAYEHAADEAFDAVRIGHLLDVIGTSASTVAPLRLLDAGCGTGWLTRALTRCGHLVEGIDSSELKTWAPSYLYDHVVAVDVLVHLTDDDVWRDSVVNLAALVRLGGLLVLTDHDAEAHHQWGDGQVTRSRQGYLDLLLPLGFSYNGFHPFRFRDSAAGFHVFRRIA